MRTLSTWGSPRLPGVGRAVDAGEASAPRAAAAGGAAWPSGTIEAMKWVGFAAMAADHWALLVLADPAHPLRTLGRLALPIFLLLLARNLAGGASVGRYWLRLLPFAILAEIVWHAAAAGGGIRPPDGNILFTLALAALFWETLRRLATARNPGERLVAGLAALMALVIAGHVDFGAPALLFTACAGLLLSLPHPRDTLRPAQGAVMPRRPAPPGHGPLEAIPWACLLLAAAGLAVALNARHFGSAALVALVPLALLAAPGLPDLGVKRSGWWVFYALYPAHVALLGAIGAILRG